MGNQLQLGYTTFKQGAYIVIEGKPNSGCFFIIQQGRVRSSKEAIVKGEKEEMLGPGDFIGVVSTMSSQSHIETALALSDVVLIKVHQQQYIGLIQQSPAVAIKIIMQFSQRLRHLNDTLAEITMKTTAEAGPSHLYNVGEYYVRQKQYSQAFYAYAKYYKHCPQGEKIPAVKEILAKLAKLTNDTKTDFGSDQINRTYLKNTLLFAEGEPGDELFIIQRGSVKIAKIVENNEVVLAILKSGDIFGEMALLENKPRLATAMAYEECDVMVVNKSNFELMISSQPQLVAKVTTLLAERIWLIYKKLANALMLDPVGRIYNTLYTQLEKNRVALDGSASQASYTFNFGWAELLALAGLNKENSSALYSKIEKNPKIQITDTKIHIVSVMEIVRQTDYYRKMDARDRLKQKS
ncbi:MAG: cyclic nucleotide-binding domain-containing protein [Treponema sp.]|nr:cyclic nucleotide-binding domain-containing protein [Treponema sp.]